MHLQGSCKSKHTDAENTETVSSFMPEEKQLFLRRFEEGFNLRTWPQIYMYMYWLKLNHLKQISPFFSSEPSLLDFFPETTPLDAIAVCDDSSNTKVAIIIINIIINTGK